MEFKDLSPEQQEKAKACSTPEELLELAKSEGYELTEEELEGVSGGWCPMACDDAKCPDRIPCDPFTG